MTQVKNTQEKLSFEKVWLMFQETREQMKETDRKMKETDRKIDKMLEEARIGEKKIDKMLEEARIGELKLDKLAKMYGGVSNNSKDFAEEFFFNALKKKDEILGISYEEVSRNMEKATKKLEGEYDIVLHNGDTLVVIEVKYKFHPNDVDDFYERKIPNFQKLFPIYNDKKIVFGIAGLVLPNETKKKSFDYGFLILGQSGENLSILNAQQSELRKF